MTRKSAREIERELDRLTPTDDAPAPEPMILYEDPKTGVLRDAEGTVVDETDADPLVIIAEEHDDDEGGRSR